MWLAVERNQAAALSQFQDHFASTRLLERRKRTARIARTGKQRRFVRAKEEDIDAGNYLQNFSGDLLGGRHSDVE